ncbi:MAG: biotin--[acetyl-CoA-carboxylase] ligase [Ignavibacteriae bacterium]|nr:biotin--[acetyl-CoA-carboxylase] ligase [Ignavibacteriota bacterium]
MFTERELRRGLRAKVFGNKIYTFQTIDSTNNCIKALANVGAAEGVVVLAEQQTAGRGRLGRTWLSQPEENLTFSVLLRPEVSTESINLLPLYVAVAVSQAIENSTGLRAECKWPNDLLIDKKKVAGILIESSMRQNRLEYVVVGLGLNVNQMQFTNGLLQKATSLKLETGKDFDRAKLLREILFNLETHYTQAVENDFKSVIPFWLSRTTMINKPIVVSQGNDIISGVVTGLSLDGGLVLQTNGRSQTMFAGDVTILADNPEQYMQAGSTTQVGAAFQKI